MAAGNPTTNAAKQYAQRFFGPLWIFLISTLMMLPFLSCSSDKDSYEVPPGIIPKDSMVDVLVDMYISESMLANIHSRYDSLKEYRRIQLDAVLAKNNISRARFDSSYHYYETDLETLKKIQDEVVVELTKLKDKARKE